MAKVSNASKETVLKAQEIVAQADLLVSKREEWQQNEYARSNTRLYEILGQVLGMYEKVKEDKALRTETVKQLKKQLEAAGVRIQTNTLVLTMFVRYVFRTDRQRALNYTRTLQAAISEGITADKLAQHVEACGGVEQCKKRYEKSATVVAKELAIADAMERVEEQLAAMRDKPLGVVKVPAEFVADAQDKEFMFVLATAEADGTVKLLSAIPATSEGKTKWAKEQLALFLSKKSAAASKSASKQRKQSAIDKAKATAKSKSPTASETVGDLVAA